MIEELCRVVAIEAGAVWVEPLSENSCSGCVAGCGQGGRCTRVRALSGMPLQVGDSVIVGMCKDFLLCSALAVYLLPLLGLFAFALVIRQLGFEEPLVVLAGFLGFAFVWVLVRKAGRRAMKDSESQPVVLRVLSSPSEG